MKSFMYMLFRSKPTRDGTRTGIVKIWTIKRNTPEFVGGYNFTFQSDNQALMSAAEKLKLLPRRYFEQHASGGYAWGPYRLRQEKVADFHQI